MSQTPNSTTNSAGPGPDQARELLAAFQRELIILRAEYDDPGFKEMANRISDRSQTHGASGSHGPFNRLVGKPLTEAPKPSLVRGFVLGLRVPELSAVVSKADAAAREERNAEWEERAAEWEESGRTLIRKIHELEGKTRWPEQQHHQQPWPGGLGPGGGEAESRGSGRPRHRRYALLGVAAAVVSLVVVAVGLVLWPDFAARNPSEPKVALSGKVTCVSSATVSGVWVEAGPGLSNFAAFHATSRPSTADFAYAIPPGAPYSVHVGCGFKPDGGWASDNRSDQVTGGSMTFLCSDNPTVFYGACHPATSKRR